MPVDMLESMISPDEFGSREHKIALGKRFEFQV
jgi:hypothetical protein